MILAKIAKAVFHRLSRPGDTLVFNAKLEQFSPQGASATGQVLCNGALVAEIDLMFSHIDQNMAGLRFPKHNFVFTDQFISLLKGYTNPVDVPL